MSSKKKIIIIGISTLVLAGVVCSVLFWFIPLSKYNQAKALADAGKNDEAMQIFYDLKGFKDSQQQYEKIKNEINEAKYVKASEALEKEEFDKAKELFLEISDYKDSKRKADSCDILKEQSNQYKKALEKMKKGSYDSAKAIFLKISDFKDSKNKAKECDSLKAKEADYKKAKVYLKNEEFDMAISIFKKLGSYKDCKEQLKKAKSAKANWGEIKNVELKFLNRYPYTKKQEEEGIPAIDGGDIYDSINFERVKGASGYEVIEYYSNGGHSTLRRYRANPPFYIDPRYYPNPVRVEIRAFKETANGKVFLTGPWKLLNLGLLEKDEKNTVNCYADEKFAELRSATDLTIREGKEYYP